MTFAEQCEEMKSQVQDEKYAMDLAKALAKVAHRETEKSRPSISQNVGGFTFCLATSGVPQNYNNKLGTAMIVTCGLQSWLGLTSAREQYDEALDREIAAWKEYDEARSTYESHKAQYTEKCRRGCQSRGGPGGRRPSGKCRSWSDKGADSDEDFL